MEYQVPQFIEIEDKIFGPFTLKQFIFVAGGIGICAGLVLYLPRIIGIILSIPIAALAWALAFYRVNDRTFIDMLEAGFTFYSKNRLYLWKREEKSAASMAVVAPAAAAPHREKLGISRGKLKDLAWSLDIQDQNVQSPDASH